MFITLEDETGIANLVIWPSLFDKERRTILSASMLEVRGRLQREGDVVHLVAHHLTDMTPLLRQVGQRDAPFPLPHGRGGRGPIGKRRRCAGSEGARATGPGHFHSGHAHSIRAAGEGEGFSVTSGFRVAPGVDLPGLAGERRL